MRRTQCFDKSVHRTGNDELEFKSPGMLTPRGLGKSLYFAVSHTLSVNEASTTDYLQ